MQVRRLAKKAGFHAVGGVAGLHLQVKQPPAASWVYKKKVGERRREYGLGPYPDITLSRARDKAREYLELIEQGVEPLEDKAARKSALMASQAKQKTFREVARQYITKKSKEYKTAKQTQKITSHMESYVYPHIGNMVVGDIERAHIVDMLKPIWETKTDTATRVRAAVERVLDLAGAEGLRSGDNPARWTGNLSLSLPAPKKISKVKHFSALPVADMQEFMDKLAKEEWTGSKALRFTILTAARSGETRGATWDEIDLNAKEWVIPAERMKGGRTHRVPLTAEAVKLVKSLPKTDDCKYLFPNTKGGMISDMTMSKAAKRLGGDVTVHGFRATFRTWAQDHTAYPEEVCELALAHVNSDRTRAAYARSELIDKRRKLMNEWERFCKQGLLTKRKMTKVRRRTA